MRNVLPVAGLLAVSAAGAVWSARPWIDLAVAPTGRGAAGLGVGAALLLVTAVAAVGSLLVWLARKDLGRAVRLFLLAAATFGLLLLAAPVVVDAGAPAWAWAAALAAAAGVAWLLREGRRAWLRSALAAGGFAGLLGGLAGLAALAIVVALVCAYDAWAVRRQRMQRVARAVDDLRAPLQVGEPSRFSLGLGDLILPASLVAASSVLGLGAGVGAAGGALAGCAALACGVRRWGDLPGTPFLCGGALAGAAGVLAFA